MSTERFAVDLIHVPERIRSRVDSERVSALADSMSKLGLMTPITVYMGEYDTDEGPFGGPILIAGRHRLKAAEKLGWKTIECVVSKAGETERRMWEIAENLHRAELTVQERAEHIAEWVRLSEKGAQLAPPGGRQPHSKGIKAASRELGMERTDVQRAVKIDSIAPDAKKAAKSAGLDDNQSALLKVAAAPKDRQVETVQRIAQERTARHAEPRLMSGEEFGRKLFQEATQAYRALTTRERRRFVEMEISVDPAVSDMITVRAA